MATLISACSDEEPQKAVRSESPKPQKEDQQLPPNPDNVSSTSLGGKPIATLDLNNAGQASLLRNANAQTPDELVGPAPSVESNSGNSSILGYRRTRNIPGVLNTRIENSSISSSITIIKAIQEFTEQVDPVLDNIEEIIQLEAADSPDFINDDMNFLEAVEKAKKLINNPIIHLNKNNITIATRIKRYQELTERFEDQLEMLSDIKISFDQLAAYGYELIIVDNKYQWKEKEIILSDGSVVSWNVTYIKINEQFKELTYVMSENIFYPISQFSSKAVGDYGKKYKDIMNSITLEKWRSVNKIFKAIEFEIDQFVQQ